MESKGKGENGGCGCLGFVIAGLLGGWFLQYDLNHWVPILHKAFPDVIHDASPYNIFPWLFIAGIFLGSPAFAVAILTFFLVMLRIIN